MAELRVTYVPAQHWSSRSLRDRRRMLWGGFVVESAAGRIYFAGDTGFFAGFDAIRSRCGAPDVALLPIGAYEPRWFMTAQHMNPAEAVEAHRMLGAGRSLGMHWGTFQLTDEGIDEPLRALDLAKAAAGLASRGVSGAGSRRDRALAAAAELPRPISDWHCADRSSSRLRRDRLHDGFRGGARVRRGRDRAADHQMVGAGANRLLRGHARASDRRRRLRPAGPPA